MSASRRIAVMIVAALAIPAVAFAQAAAAPAEMHHRHDDPRAYIASLDDPARDAYQKPAEVMKALALREGEVVADIGAGSGYFALRFARAVGEAGRVFAVDVSPDMVRHLNRRLRDAGVRNVVSVLSLKIDNAGFSHLASWAIKFGEGRDIWRINASMVIALVVVLAGFYLLHYTRFGRTVYGLGSGDDERALMRAG